MTMTKPKYFWPIIVLILAAAYVLPLWAWLMVCGLFLLWVWFITR